jgi:hypothetical protein
MIVLSFGELQYKQVIGKVAFNSIMSFTAKCACYLDTLPHGRKAECPHPTYKSR